MLDLFLQPEVFILIVANVNMQMEREEFFIGQGGLLRLDVIQRL